MSLRERNLFNIVNIIVFVQGAVYFFYKYFQTQDTDFGPRPHNLTSTFLHLHIILVPLLVFSFGYMYKIHVYKKLKQSKRKKTGWLILIFMSVMIFSGYLLQMGFELEATQFIAWIHISISLLWFVFFLWHSKKN